MRNSTIMPEKMFYK